jgi:exodeoxyribonuclease VII large subunit
MEQLGLDFAVSQRPLTVAEVTAAIRGLLEAAFDNCRVAGEISNCRRAPSGHYYFTLKDGEAQLKCVCFRQSAMYLKVKPQDGLEVIARGRIGVYEARGEYQLYVDSVEPQGHGALQLAFELLKRKLAAEGLFEAERKRPLPRMPQRIGIVTSPNGAAIADILRVLRRRFRGLHVRLYPVAVQGEKAVAEIAAGLRYFSASGWPEVLIVGRGGGSIEDLWAFNEELVARAIAGSTVPVIAAVGHQTDFTIADFVADVRAPTPSAAAEIAVPEMAELLAGLVKSRSRLQQGIRYRLERARRRMLESGVERPASLLRRRTRQLSQRIDDCELQLRESFVGRLRRAERRLREIQHCLAAVDLRFRLGSSRRLLEQLQNRTLAAASKPAQRGRARLEAATVRLQALSPMAVLERGYSILTTMEGAVIRRSADAGAGELLRARLREGELGLRVESTDPKRSG